MSSEDTVAQLMELRALTGLTGVIHEAQVQQLRYWPLIAVSHAEKSEVTFETDDKGGNRTVFIAFKLDPKKKAPPNLQRRLHALDKNVQWLLGNDWKVVMIAAGKAIYTGRRRSEPKPKAKPEPKKRKKRGK